MTTPTKAERTQRRILDAAVKLFNTRGYAGTCIRDIMEATGLAKGGIYGNFENKHQLELAAFNHALRTVNEAATRELENCRTRGGGPLEQLRTLVSFYERYAIDPPLPGGCPILNTVVEADDTDPQLRRRAARALDDWRKNIVRIIQAGIERREIRQGVEANSFALVFIATVEGSIMLAKAFAQPGMVAAPLQHIRWLIDTQLATAGAA